jgi:hypothetical protein
MNDNKNLIAFKAISDFVNAISEEYGKKIKGLKLYARLLKKTTFSHENAINKHVSLFTEFCVRNRDAILSRNQNNIKEEVIKYSDVVYLNMKNIFNICNSQDKDIVWKHILTISAILDPTGKAKEILKKSSEDKNVNNEANFLTDIISKVEQTVKPDANPIEAITSMMNSGVFTELMSGMKTNMEEGKLDMNKMLGVVQGMFSSLNNGENKDSNGSPPDIMQMLSSVTGMMNQGPKIEQEEDDKN